MGNNNTDFTKRFSNRVEDYVKYRPGYPNEVINFLKEELGFDQSWKVADIGSGTGILSKLFLENGNIVFCVEPNNEMRSAGEKYLKEYFNVTSLNGTAESIPLQNNFVDFITAGQAFHWFDVGKSKQEFDRILKPGGWVVLIWNERLTNTDDFAREYEKLLLDYSVDYKMVDHRNINEKILKQFFSSFELKVFPNRQEFDYDGVKGRLLSSSYVPKEDHPNFTSMIKKLKEIFDEFQANGKIIMKYETQLYYGKL